MNRISQRWTWIAVCCLCLAGGYLAWADPVRLVRPEVTFQAEGRGGVNAVIDGVVTGPNGWTTAPRVSEAQSLVVSCERPLEADELEVTLFFLAGRPYNPVAEFGLSYTTDAMPSLTGNWQPLEVLRFNSDVTNLRKIGAGRVHADFFDLVVSGNVPDDSYRGVVRLPGGRATGFRLDVFPVTIPNVGTPGQSWWHPYDFLLTEFRLAAHLRDHTNIALHQPVKASHPLHTNPGGEAMSPANLTDGNPATVVHPHDPGLGDRFYFEIDLGRVADLDHIGLRNRADCAFDRLSRIKLALYDLEPATAGPPLWEGRLREDGSHPGPGEVDIARAESGKGAFRGRYLRISSDNPVPLSPQLTEAEVYETRCPEIEAVLADGQEIPLAKTLEFPPGTRRVSFCLKIPQSGMPSDVRFRWCLRGDIESWQDSRVMTVDMPCPSPGRTVFEAQAFHSDGQWDSRVFRQPILTRQYVWETSWFQWGTAISGILAAIGTGILLTRRRIARKIAQMKAETALANERSRIARDIHDDLGVCLTRIALQCELMQDDCDQPAQMRQHVKELSRNAKEVTRAVDEIVWAVTPANDTLEKFTAFIGQFVQNSLKPAGIACRLDLPMELPDCPMESTLRHHLYLVVREGLNNILRHADASTVHFSLVLQGNLLMLVLSDDGRGFETICDSVPDADRICHGNGLNNMRKRMQEIGGTIEITSRPGGGTTLTLHLPW